MTTPMLFPIAAVPAGFAVAFAQDTKILTLAFFVATLAYAAVYARLTQFRWCFSARTLRPGNGQARVGFR